MPLNDRGGNVTVSERSSLYQALTNPRSVALVGASGTGHRLTARPQTFLSKHGFGGRVYPVNPTREDVLGLKAYPDIVSLPECPDHAYVLLDAEPALEAVAQCAAAGVKVVSVLAGGFSEAGEEGRHRQDELVRVANDAGVLLIGPNSTGVADTRSGFACTTNAAFGAEMLLPGRFAVISQSGSLIGTLLSRGAACGIGFSTFVSVGNEAQTDISGIGDILLSDSRVDGLVLFLETVRNPNGLASFARAAYDMGKPVLAYVIGRSDAGRSLSVSHSGAITGSAAAMNSFLSYHGVQQVDVLEALVEGPAAVTHARKTIGDRSRAITVVSTTGGGGATVIDQLGARGVQIAECPNASACCPRGAGHTSRRRSVDRRNACRNQLRHHEDRHFDAHRRPGLWGRPCRNRVIRPVQSRTVGASNY